MAIYNFIKNFITNVDNKRPVCAIYCDMTQAFYYVNHDILLKKLEDYGIRGNILALMESYLKNRTQYTEVTRIDLKNKKEEIFKSDVRSIKFGVPQGSVLGPLLFLIWLVKNRSDPSNIFDKMELSRFLGLLSMK